MPANESIDVESRIARLKGQIDRYPTSAWLHQALGEAHLYRGALDEAEAAYRRSLELDPCNYWARLLFGNVLYGQRRYREALAEFELARDLAPERAMAYIAMADTFHCLDDLAQTDEYYRKAVAVEPDDETACQNLARWLATGRNPQSGSSDQGREPAGSP